MSFIAPPPIFKTRRRGQRDASAPAPLTAKAAARQVAALHRAAEIVGHIPAPGETLHAIMTGQFDLMDLLRVIVAQIGPCNHVRFATLSYSRKNLVAILDMFDSGRIGGMSLLCSTFFREHNKDIWKKTLAEFRERKQRAAATYSHCKITTFDCADGRKLTMEGSGNLRSASAKEQFTLTHDPVVHDWHAAWIDAEIAKREATI
jgi:hypothetical protein